MHEWLARKLGLWEDELEQPSANDYLLIYGGGLLAVGVGLIVLFIAWRSAPEPPSAPRPRPRIVSWSEVHNLIADNEVMGTVRNDGVAGDVRVNVTWYTHSYVPQRGESGAEQFLRENFTRDTAPADRLVKKAEEAGGWYVDLTLDAGEQRAFHFRIPGHTTTVAGELLVSAGLSDNQIWRRRRGWRRVLSRRRFVVTRAGTTCHAKRSRSSTRIRLRVLTTVWRLQPTSR